MRNHALLINVTRGNIVDGPSLLEALEKGVIGGAGLDTSPGEPLSDDHPLWNMENVVVTPHTAGGSPVRVARIVDVFCDNLEALSGRSAAYGSYRQAQGVLVPSLFLFLD